MSSVQVEYRRSPPKPKIGGPGTVEDGLSDASPLDGVRTGLTVAKPGFCPRSVRDRHDRLNAVPDGQLVIRTLFGLEVGAPWTVSGNLSVFARAVLPDRKPCGDAGDPARLPTHSFRATRGR